MYIDKHDNTIHKNKQTNKTQPMNKHTEQEETTHKQKINKQTKTDQQETCIQPTACSGITIHCAIPPIASSTRTART